MKHWRVSKEETITFVVYVRAETRDEAIQLASQNFERYDSWISSPTTEEVDEEEFTEHSTQTSNPDPGAAWGPYTT